MRSKFNKLELWANTTVTQASYTTDWIQFLAAPAAAFVVYANKHPQKINRLWSPAYVDKYEYYGKQFWKAFSTENYFMFS